MAEASRCCASKPRSSSHPDHGAELIRLRRVRGQLEGIEKMIDEGRYCADILIQMRAAGAALRKVEAGVLERHLRGCVSDAIQSRNRSVAEAKIRELTELFIAHP